MKAWPAIGFFVVAIAGCVAGGYYNLHSVEIVCAPLGVASGYILLGRLLDRL